MECSVNADGAASCAVPRAMASLVPSRSSLEDSMRSISIHPLSLGLGIVLAGVIFLSMSQATVATPLRVEYLAHPRDCVIIRGGTPYTVPAGRILAVTAVGSCNSL